MDNGGCIYDDNGVSGCTCIYNTTMDNGCIYDDNGVSGEWTNVVRMVIIILSYKDWQWTTDDSIIIIIMLIIFIRKEY